MTQPKITAFLDSTGQTNVTGTDGESLERDFADLPTARRALREAAVKEAAERGAPVHLEITDPSGVHSLLVHEDGDTELIGGDLPAPSLEAPASSRFQPALVKAPVAAPPMPLVEPVQVVVKSAAQEPIVQAVEAPHHVPEIAPVIESVPEDIPLVEQEPLRRRRPTAADFSASRPEPSQAPAQEGWQGRVNKSLGLRLAPGPLEISHRQWRASVQRGLAGHKTVVFVNLKGGATKTTGCYLVAATIGRVRGGNVLAWDNNENKGTLGDRAMSASHDHTAIDLLANAERFATPSNAPELINYVRPQGENKFHVLASQNKASDQEVIDGPAFVQLQGVLHQFYHLALVDTGNASTAGTWQAAVDIADEIVLVAMNKEDSSKTLAATVDTLIELGFEEKLARGVLLVTQPPVPSQNRKARLAANAQRLERIQDHFGHYVRAVVVAPYDAALDDGGQIIYENLTEGTRDAYLEATAAIVDGL